MSIAENRLGGRRLRLDPSRLIGAAVVGSAVGAACEWSVLHLSSTLLPLSNTAAPWVLVAFLAALTARRMSESVVLALVALVALVAGFYVAQATRGWSVSQHQVVLWTGTSLVMGPLIGLTAGALRYAGRSPAALGVGVVGGLLVGEAVHGLRDLKFVSVAGYWDVQIAVGLGLAVGLTLWRAWGDLGDCVRNLALALVACAAAGLVTFAAFQVP